MNSPAGWGDIPKDLNLIPQTTNGLRRLRERKVRYIVRHKQRGKSSREIAFEMRITFPQLREYGLTGSHKEYLPIKKRGRKVKELSEEEKEIIGKPK